MLSLPNLLTLSRILAVPILVFLLWRPAPLDYAITFVLYCIVGITDYLDGYLARAQGLTSRLGQFLDPIADKIMVAAVLMMLISSRNANPVPEIAGLGGLSATAAKAIGVREIRGHLHGECSLADAVAAIQQASRRYAKRQVTWIKRERGFQTICLPPESTASVAADQILELYPCLRLPPPPAPSAPTQPTSEATAEELG
jgi:hypothetical protein